MTAPPGVQVRIVSKASNPRLHRVLYRMSQADARILCSHPATSGAAHMLVWTTEWDPADEGKTWRWFTDNGKYDVLIGQLGLTKLPRYDTRTWTRDLTTYPGHPRWTMPEHDAGLPERQITDYAIEQYGRRHIERLLDGLPPLPEEAWTVDR